MRPHGDRVNQALRRIAVEAAWAPLAVLIGHQLGARLFGHEPYVDPLMHFAGGAAAAFFFRQASAIATEALGTMRDVALDLVGFGLACACAVLWEIGEFASDQVLGTHVQRSLENTMRDLLMGVTGAVLVLVALRLGRRVGSLNP
jgi:hypothetical protein